MGKKPEILFMNEKKYFFLLFFCFLIIVNIAYAIDVEYTPTKDGIAREDAKTTEYGADDDVSSIFKINAPAGSRVVLLGFTISAIPSVATIDSAQLWLYAWGNGVDAGETFNVTSHHVYTSFSWSEGSGGSGGNSCTGNEFCWNNRPSGSDFNPTYESSQYIKQNTPSANSWINWSVKNMVSTAVGNGDSTISIYLNSTIGNNSNVSSTNDFLIFYSSEYSTAEFRPALNISYSFSIPIVTIKKPDNVSNLFFKDRPFMFNYSVYADVISNASLYGNFSGTWKLNQTNTSTISNNNADANFSGLNISKGEYIWNIEVCDTDGDCAFADANFTFNVSNSAPDTPTLTSPINNSNITVTSTWLNYTSSDNDGDTITYYVYADQNPNPVTLVYSGINEYFNYTGLNDGETHFWKVQCDDNMANSSNSSINRFYVSTVAPNISIFSPVNNSWNTTSLDINISFNATDIYGIDACELWINSTGWHKNQTKNVQNNTIDSFLVNLSDEKQFYFNMWCNDTHGNGGWANNNISFNIDTTIPSLSVTSPIHDSTYTTTTVSLTISASDPFLDLCYYYLYKKDTGALVDSDMNILCSGTTILTTPYYAGGYKLNVFANDTAKNSNNSNEINFTTQASGSSSSGGGGGGGGSQTQLICNESDTVWSITTLYGRLGYTFGIPYKNPKPVEKRILLTNYGSDNLTISLSCEQTDEEELNICDYVTFSENQIRLTPNPKEPKEVIMYVIFPNATIGDEFSFNVFADDNEICTFKLNNKVYINRFSFTKWRSITLPNGEPYYYLAIIPALIAWLICIVAGILISRKNPIIGILGISIVLGASLFGFLIWI